jgi:hypothetical protein
MSELAQFYTGFALTYLIYENVVCPPPTFSSQCSLNQLKTRMCTVHIHHWILHILLLLTYIQLNKNPNWIILGSLISGIFHGIVEYEDWWIVLKQ